MSTQVRTAPQIDRGYVVIRSGQPGQQTVIICGAVDRGQPVRAYAVHRRATVEVAAEVRTVQRGGTLWSADVVETFADPERGVVRVQPITEITEPSVLEGL